MSALNIFLDDGGVMNDNEVRGPQWQRLVAEYLSPRLGGDLEKWSEANRIVFPRVWQDFTQKLERDPEAEFAPISRELDRSWLAGMCALVGVAAPGGDACIELSQETSRFVTRNVRSAYDGAVAAIRELHALGASLATASGGRSWELDGYLTGMGVRDCFMLPLYGPDIVNTPKETPLYYQRIFAHASVDPRSALAVDDTPQVLDWAKSLGARTVLVTTRGASNSDRHLAKDTLADLPALLAGRAQSLP